MADQLTAVVQRMIDAGESEENIAAVIQHSKTTPAPDSGGINPWIAGAGVAAAGVAGLALHNPSLAGKIGQGAMDLRRMSMLSGLAPIKSFLGNIGGSAYSSIERGSMAPLREMLSPTTAREALASFKAGPSYASAGPSTGISKWNIPGRVMGALDTASQSALQRAGLTAEEAATEMLQAPIPQKLSQALDNPVMQYLVPFRRTPFNQLIEGAKSFAPQTTGQKVALGTALGTGAATGAIADDPKTVALGTAFSGKRGLPFALAAGATRALTSGSKRKGAEVVQGMSPVSDYSLAEGAIGPVMDPTSIIPKPAAFSAITYLKSLLGLD